MAQPTITPAVIYLNPRAALDFLRDAFGFELDMMIEDESGALVHSQMMLGNGRIMVGTEWSEDHKSPRSIGGKCTQSVHLHLEEDIGRPLRARPRGRRRDHRGTVEPSSMETAPIAPAILKGHIWTFSQTVEVLTPEQWDRNAPGLKTWAREGYGQ